jgi:hypothetical protein
MADIVVMALDQAPENTGWAIGRPRDNKPLFGKFRLPPWGQDEPARMLAFHNFLTRSITTHGVTHLCYEVVPRGVTLGKAYTYTKKRGPDAGQIKAGVRHGERVEISDNQKALIGHVWFLCALHKIQCSKQEVSDARRHFIQCVRVAGLQGDAHTKELKCMAMKACAARGWVVENHDVAEALMHLDFKLTSIDKGHQAWSNPISRRAELALWNGVAA